MSGNAGDGSTGQIKSRVEFWYKWVSARLGVRTTPASSAKIKILIDK